MSPSSFTFKLSVPNDPDMVTLVADVARHAAGYARVAADATDAFVARARTLAAAALSSATGSATQVTVTADAGTLTLAMGDASVSQLLP